MLVWSWDLLFEELALPPHGYYMAVTWLSHESYSNHCCVTASFSYCGYMGNYGAQTTPQVYKAGGFYLYSLASVSQVVLWLYLSHWLPPPTLSSSLFSTSCSLIFCSCSLIFCSCSLSLTSYSLLLCFCSLLLLCCFCLCCWGGVHCYGALAYCCEAFTHCPSPLAHCSYSLAHCCWYCWNTFSSLIQVQSYPDS